MDFLVSSETNKDTNYFSNIVESAARDIHCYVVQTNDSTYGDSRIVAPANTESMNLVRVKGGENETFLTTTLELQALREHQIKSVAYQMRPGSAFKPVPAGWDRALVRKRMRKQRRPRS